MKKQYLFRTLILAVMVAMSVQVSAQKSERYKAKNGVNFDFEVILPDNFDKNDSYELAMVFTEIEKKDDSHERTTEALRNLSELSNTIFIVPKVPVGKPHWISHPIHHGLNDLMDEMRERYGKKGQKFHFIGHRLGGRVAQTYSGMSSQYVASVSFVHSSHWGITKQQYFDETFGNGFEVYVYDENSTNLGINVTKAKFKKATDFKNAILQLDKFIKSL